MKAAVVTAETGPDGIRILDVPAPTPNDTEIIVDVHHGGLSFPDLLLSRGAYQQRPAVPFILGAEAAGVVSYAPPQSDYVIGDRVMVVPVSGGFAEQLALAPQHLTAVPPELTLAEGAALVLNYQTAYFALHLRAQLRAGETVAVFGAAGGVGVATVGVAKALGATVIALTRRAQAAELLHAAGAAEVIVGDQWPARLRRLAPDGVDVVLDPVGAPIFDEALRHVAPDGRYVVVGFAGGDGDGSGIPAVKLNRLLFRNISIVGAGRGEYLRAKPQILTEIATGVRDLVAAGLRPPLTARYPLGAVPTALTDLAAGNVVGKAIIDISPG